MGNYSLAFKKSVLKDMRSIPRKDQKILLKKIQLLASNPFPPQSQKLTAKEQYRLRWGHYRVLYTIKKKELIIVVVKIASRKDAYK